MVQFVMWGKTEQVQTTGANLVNGMDNIYHYTQSGENKRHYCWGYSLGGGPLVLDTPLRAGTYTFSFYCDKSATIYLSKAPYVTGQFVTATTNQKVVGDIRNGLQRYFCSFQITDEIDILGIYCQDYTACFGGMINSGNKPLPYEPYTGGKPSPSTEYQQPIEVINHPVTVTVKGDTEQQSITLTPPKPMTKWDKLEKVDGMWCWVYQTTEFELNGTETWNKYGDLESTGIVFTTYFANTLPGLQSTICDKYLNKDNAWGTDNKNSYGIYGDHPSSLSRYFRMPDAQITTPEQWKEWLGNHPLRFICKSSTQESIPLSPSEQEQLNAITMYAPETEVTNNADAEMELTYTVDTKSYVDSKIAAISAAVLEA